MFYCVVVIVRQKILSSIKYLLLEYDQGGRRLTEAAKKAKLGETLSHHPSISRGTTSYLLLIILYNQ